MPAPAADLIAPSVLKPMIDRGCTVVGIAQLLGTSRTRVERSLLRHGLQTQNQQSLSKRGSYQKRVAAARKLRAKGWTIRRIAEHFGASLSTVHQWMRDQRNAEDRTFAPKPDPTPQELEERKAAIRAEWSEDEKRKRAGVSRAVECDFGHEHKVYPW